MELSEYAKQLRELADIIEEQDQKYYVQVIDIEDGYLNIDKYKKEPFLSNNLAWMTDYQATFTKAEIEDLKTNPVLKAINWDEVKLISAD